MFLVQNGLICWLDAIDGKAGDTLLKDRTRYGHNLIVENFQQGYGFTGTSIKVKQSKGGTSNNNALYIANGGFKTSCKSFCICIERHNTNQPWYIFDGRLLKGQGLSTNHCFNGNTGSSYDNSKTRRDGVLTYTNSDLDINKKTFLYFELKEAELFTLSILMRYTKDENTEGKFYSLYAYNRALTEEEILQNMEYENNKISYVNENNLPKIVKKLSNASNIKITGNKYGNRVQTVIDKIVEKADNVTKAIEQEVVNEGYSFKVGQGNNINVTSDVQDSFSNLAIKGISYQNLFNSLEIKPSPITAVIGSRFKTVVAETPANQYGNVIIPISELYKFKPNHKYTLFVNITKNTFVNKDGVEAKHRPFCINTYNYAGNMIESSNEGNYSLVFEQGATGIKKCVITTKNFDNPSNPIKNCFELYIGSYYTKPGCELSGEFIIMEGDHINNPNIPRYFEGIVGIGDKSKNLFNKKTITENYYINSSGGLTQSTVSYYSDFIEIDSNTTYTMGKVSIKRIALYDENKNFITRFDSATGNSLVVNSSNAKFVRISGEISELESTQFEKSSIATEYEPYWNGHKIEILSNGKNLFSNKNNFITGGSGFAQTIGESVTLSSIGDANHKYLKVELPVGKKYTVTIDKRNTYPDSWGNTIFESIDNNIVIGGTYRTIAKSNNDITKVSVLTFETTLPYVYIHIGRRNSDEAYEDWFAKVLTSFETLQIEQNDSGSSIEPYKEDKIEILLDEPLMRLPDGLCDEITKDGKLIRRIGKIVLDGSQLMFKSTAIGADGSNKFGYRVKDGVIKSSLNLLCNNFKLDKNNGHMTIQQNAIDNNTMCGIYFATLDYDNVTDFKQWLSQNPTTVYYELKTPIITDLSETQIRIFKNGSLTFNTLVAPESTHYVQLNKSAQIQSAIKQSQVLNNKITVLENNYDSLMLSTMSILDNLEFDYKLK